MALPALSWPESSARASAHPEVLAPGRGSSVPVRWVSCPREAFPCRCWYEEQSSGAARSRLLMVKHWRDHTWPRDLKWTGGHLTGASYPVSCWSCQFPPRGGHGSPGCKCCRWCHMSRGGDWVRSEFSSGQTQAWVLGWKRGNTATFSYTPVPHTGPRAQHLLKRWQEDWVLGCPGVGHQCQGDTASQ